MVLTLLRFSNLRAGVVSDAPYAAEEAGCPGANGNLSSGRIVTSGESSSTSSSLPTVVLTVVDDVALCSSTLFCAATVFDDLNSPNQ